MTVRQLANAIDIIKYFTRRRQPATLAELVAEFDWPRSSIFNIVATFVERGYMYEPEAVARSRLADHHSA